MEMYEDSSYMTAVEFLGRLYADLGRDDFHVGFFKAPENEEEYVDILDFLRKRLGDYDFERTNGRKFE